VRWRLSSGFPSRAATGSPRTAGRGFPSPRSHPTRSGSAFRGLRR
jgi:hypothetical protein